MKWSLRNTALGGNESILKWIGESDKGGIHIWEGFTSGPITLSEMERRTICQKLVPIEIGELETLATQSLQLVKGAYDKSLILHTTTPGQGAFEGDLAMLMAGQRPKNYAGYVETRSVYLGKPGDMAVGRMEAWKAAAGKGGLELVDVHGLEYYNLMDALLKQGEAHLEKPVECIDCMIGFLKKYPDAVVRLYGLGAAMQCFLVWLKQQAGLEKIYIDANSPEVAGLLNTKNILYTNAETAQQLKLEEKATPYQLLKEEQKESFLSQKMGLSLPNLPGYTIKREGETLSGFTQQILQAVFLLQERYGLKRGCLKAASAGDGGNITPNIDLSDANNLKMLAESAYRVNDDYVLESQVHYAVTSIGRSEVKLAPSAHIRGGVVAPGITLQFTEGTSWAGNVFINKQLAEKVGISTKQYQQVRQIMSSFLAACEQREMGLTIAGIDFAIGQVRGKFGEDQLFGIQDPNISFNGAEFLRVFMEKTSKRMGWKLGGFHAVTWVFVPKEECTDIEFADHLSKHLKADTYSEVVAVVPGCWGMIGVAALDFDEMIGQLEYLKENNHGFYQ